MKTLMDYEPLLNIPIRFLSLPFRVPSLFSECETFQRLACSISHWRGPPNSAMSYPRTHYESENLSLLPYTCLQVTTGTADTVNGCYAN